MAWHVWEIVKNENIVTWTIDGQLIATVDVTGGLTGPLVDTVLDELELSLDGIVPGLPWTGADTAELSFMTIGASDVHAFVGIGGPYWTDTDFDEVVDVGELSSDAKGLWIEDFDFGMAIMTPTNVLDFAKYFSLKATANEISVVNIEGVEIEADDLLVEINQSTPSIYGLPLFPVVDFAATYASERQSLFDLLANGDGSISASDLDAAIGTGHGITTALTTVDQLMTLLQRSLPRPKLSAKNCHEVASIAMTKRMKPAHRPGAGGARER